ncbi:chorismate mutase [Roseinatronobacter alkalisoli]|uniref:chorismate mutase n=1 Tax=Roseinatronobacter alkalisoli TaxID=3028235 RepID=A0ABT5T631_9RHOB|nr:chorismate mutase [Roseinatronobacter sp. HJB301]MDD7969871.1 chorismate mutase [Roseinatronobacter sp. HJB301]
MPNPAECQSMKELRAEIDRIDCALIALLAERSGYIDRAAQLKPAEGLPARIDDRVAQVLENIRQNATRAGLDPRLAHCLWQQIIDWSIAREERVLGPR